MAVKGLLDPESSAPFVRDYYLRLPFSQPGGCPELAEWIDTQLVAELLTVPEIDLLVGRGGTRREGPLPRDLASARTVVAEGYTLRFRHTEKHNPRLAELARQFSTAFGGPVDLQLYWTPAEQQGFGWHYDAEEVFVLQTAGQKEWWLRKNTVNPWPLMEAIPANQHYEREIMPVMKCNLAVGDWLYIPSGYWHRTMAGPEQSISISVGILPTTPLDVYDSLRPHLIASLGWRQRLPCPGRSSPLSEDELLDEYHARIHALAADLTELLNDRELLRSFIEDLRAGR